MQLSSWALSPALCIAQGRGKRGQVTFSLGTLGGNKFVSLFNDFVSLFNDFVIFWGDSFVAITNPRKTFSRLFEDFGARGSWKLLYMGFVIITLLPIQLFLHPVVARCATIVYNGPSESTSSDGAASHELSTCRDCAHHLQGLRRCHFQRMSFHWLQDLYNFRERCTLWNAWNRVRFALLLHTLFFRPQCISGSEALKIFYRSHCTGTFGNSCES